MALARSSRNRVAETVFQELGGICELIHDTPLRGHYTLKVDMSKVLAVIGSVRGTFGVLVLPDVY